MIVVRILLNSWATLEASAPTLLRRWACNSCWRSWSASVLGTITSSPIMKGSPPASLAGGKSRVDFPAVARVGWVLGVAPAVFFYHPKDRQFIGGAERASSSE